MLITMEWLEDVGVLCNEVYNFNSTNQQCEFVKNNSDCQSAAGIFNYVQLAFCNFNNGKVEIILVYGVWVIFLFVVLGITTDNFFCPALDVIAKSLRLSQNIAGVTFLALGNGAPDIFSSVAATAQNRPELVISGLFGAGIFVSSVVAGTIMVLGPFHIDEGPFLRDIIFYLAATFWAFDVFYVGHINLLDALGFLVLYATYILVVLSGHTVVNFFRKAFGSAYYNLLDDGEEAINSFDVRQSYGNINSTDDIELLDDERQLFLLSNNMQLAMFINDDESTPLLPQRSEQKSGIMHSWESLKRSLSPIDKAEWITARWYWKVFMIIMAPVSISLKITIPLIIQEEINQNWCQLLNATQCLIVPVFIVFSTRHAFVMVGAIPLWAVVLLVGGGLAILVLLTSKPHVPPFYHRWFAFLGFFISICWIYNIATEIVDVLKAIGVVFNINDSVLGLTVLAWGNSIGDFVANFSVAKNGSQLMAISACFGGPLLNLLVGMGVPFTLKYITQHSSIKVNYDSTVVILSVFLFVSLCSTLVAMLFLKYKARRSYGLYLLFLYFVFTIFVILNTLDVFS